MAQLYFDYYIYDGNGHNRIFVEQLSLNDVYIDSYFYLSDKNHLEKIRKIKGQKTTSRNPRSTVGTVTEIYDYLRLLYARIGTPVCPNHDIEISSQTIEQMCDKVMSYEEGSKVIILSG